MSSTLIRPFVRGDREQVTALVNAHIAAVVPGVSVSVQALMSGLEREPGEKRTGVFTSGIVSTAAGRKIALYFTGRQHAGENIADVLKQRAAESGPAIQMSDALSWNAPKLPVGVELLVAHCLAHGRRQIVEVAENFPVECRYVLNNSARCMGSTPRRATRA